MTIEQLQAYVDSKPDIRGLINVIVDYMQNNPGAGGGGFPAQLSEDTTVYLNGKTLKFQEGSFPSIFLNTLGFQSFFLAGDGTAISGFSGYANLAGNNVKAILQTNDGTNNVKINEDAQANTIDYTAAAHTFSGKIINPDIVANDFVDDAAAATGGVEIGQDYHTAGIKKVRIS